MGRRSWPGWPGGGEQRGSVLVAADGVRSTVRRLYDPAPLRYAGFTEWRGIAPCEGIEAGVQVQSYGRGTVFGWVPLRDGMVAWYGRRNAEPGGVDEPGQSKHALTEVYGDWHNAVPRLIEATPTPEESIARGAGLAIEDGVVLGRCAGDSAEATEALREYERRTEDRPHVAGGRHLSKTEGMDRWEHPAACRLRNLLLRSLPKRIALRQFQTVVTFEP
ncbi:MAG: hypothetical protein ACR2GL_06325 [Thermoleophilaceae bacterium]